MGPCWYCCLALLSSYWPSITDNFCIIQLWLGYYWPMFYRFTIERSPPRATLILCWFCCQFEVGQWLKCKSLFLWIWDLLWLGRCERKFTDDMGWFAFCNRGCQSWQKYYCSLGLRNKILLWFHLTRGEVIIQGKWKSWFLQLNNSV